MSHDNVAVLVTLATIAVIVLFIMDQLSPSRRLRLRQEEERLQREEEENEQRWAEHYEQHPHLRRPGESPQEARLRFQGHREERKHQHRLELARTKYGAGGNAPDASWVAAQRALMTPELRQQIKQRDGFACRQCACSVAKEPNLLLEVDHIHPVSRGGRSVPENLQTLCWKCNRAKGAS